VLQPAAKRKLLLEANLVAIDTSRPHPHDSVVLRPSVNALLEEIAVQQVSTQIQPPATTPPTLSLRRPTHEPFSPKLPSAHDPIRRPYRAAPLPMHAVRCSGG
jgi:hypothetical protein